MSRGAIEPPRRRPGITYAAIIALAIALGFVALADSNILIVDFIGTNPNRSHRNALAMAFIEAPLVALLVAVPAGALGIGVCGVSAGIVHRRFGRVPLWALPIVSLLCWGGVIFQAKLIDAYILPLDHSETAAMSSSDRLIALAGVYLYLLAATWLAWWLTRPRKLPSLAEVF